MPKYRILYPYVQKIVPSSFMSRSYDEQGREVVTQVNNSAVIIYMC